MNWPGDVLDGMLAQIRKANRQFLGDMLAHCRADASLAGLGKGFETRRDIDTVTEDIVTLDDTSPTLIPMRKRMRRLSSIFALRASIPCCITTAHRTASTIDANSMRRPSPMVLTMRP